MKKRTEGMSSSQIASQKDILVTLGIKPNRPDTGYGYIQMDDDKKEDNFYKVKTFTEKPDIELAKKFVNSGEFLWNAGIFIWSVSSITKAFEENLHEVSNCFNSEKNVYFTNKENDFIKTAYNSCPTISIDYGIMEKANNVYVTPGDFGWSDIGTWNSLFEFVEKDKNNNAIKGKYVFTRNTKDCIINVSNNKLIAVNNVENLIGINYQNVFEKNQESSKFYSNFIVLSYKISDILENRTILPFFECDVGYNLINKEQDWNLSLVSGLKTKFYFNTSNNYKSYQYC